MAVKTRSKKNVFSEYEKLEKFNKAEEEAREDVKLFVAGIAFTFTVLWTMLEWGQAEGWYAPSPTIYNQPGQENSRERLRDNFRLSKLVILDLNKDQLSALWKRIFVTRQK